MRTKVSIISLLLLLSVGLTSCKKEKKETPTPSPYVLKVPEGFPMPNIPADNPLTAEKIALGKRLFYDKQLSNARTISCASCHLQSNAFSDTARFSLGDKGQVGARNAPALTNVAYESELFWDGANPKLETQILAVILNHKEFDMTITDVEDRIRQDKSYEQDFQKAFGGTINIETITKAISSFERTLLSGNSKYDQYKRGAYTLTPSEQNGMDLFFDETGDCFHCHNGINFTDYGYHNTGLDSVTTDVGRYNVTNENIDMGKFKTPSLRNVEFNAPYMHDGRFKTLDQALNHYSKGGKNHPNQDANIRPLNLTPTQKQDIIAFLKTLTDTAFLNNPDFKP